MRNTENLAALLARSRSRAGLHDLARALGFGDALPVDDDLAASLGIGELTREAFLATGPGTLRALIVQTNGSRGSRESASAVAARIARAAPHLLWMLMLRRRGSPEVVLATWSAGGGRPKLSALVVDTRQVMPSDVDAVSALAAAGSALDVLTHARWIDALGREALTRRFYRTLERVVADMVSSSSGASDEVRSELAVLCVSRLLFLSFLQTKGWLDGDAGFLERTFTDCMLTGGQYHGRVLLPLFFGTLNTRPSRRAARARQFGRIPFLNGGLFTRTPLERRCGGIVFGDDAIGAVFGELLVKYRFTAREESDRWSEAAIDPEMLGRVFESLMASRDRRASGAFYTPQSLVSSVTRSALIEALAPRPAAISDIEALIDGGAPPPGTAGAILARLRGIAVLDPACGSGAFLVHVLETLADLARRLGDDRPIDLIRRSVLGASIFGVDVNPTAAWLCELRLWLSVVIESSETDPLRALPLPNLDHHIRVGDALAGEAFDRDGMHPGGAHAARLRERYMRATGPRKRALGRALERRERTIAVLRIDAAIEKCAGRRRDLLSMLRTRDLFGERVRPGRATRDTLARERVLARELRAERRALALGGALSFSFSTHFPDVAARGGFDLVIGNPPWVRLHRIPAAARLQLRRRFEVLRHATWERGAELAGVAPGFAAQTDLAALFVERALALLRDDGALALLLPAKLWRSLAGGGVRRLIAARGRVVRIEDWSEAPATFDAAVYPSLLIARSSCAEGAVSPHHTRRIIAALHRTDAALEWELDPARLRFDGDEASPWILAPNEVRTAFDRLRAAGPPLAHSMLGRPQLGVKCGCNSAFLVTLLATHGSLATVRAGEALFHIERDVLRPVMRGETLRAWDSPDDARRIVWTHAANGAPLTALPPRAMTWLSRHRTMLARRSDGRSSGPWWSLFRTAAAADDAPRVVWPDFGRTPRCTVLAPGTAVVPLNSCYVMRCADMECAMALSALLNSPLAAAWLRLVAEPARGGYLRFLAWTMCLLPLPADWHRTVELLAPLAWQARIGDPPPPNELLTAACRAYRVRVGDMEPLLAWSLR